jgi:hypothetical protein
MASALETLSATVASLTEAQAAQTLAYIERLRRKAAVQEIADLLSSDPSFYVPPTALDPLLPSERPPSRGVPASDLLIRDRR